MNIESKKSGKKIPLGKSLAYKAEYAAVLLLAGFANCLSIEAASSMASFFGKIAFQLLSRKRHTALQNLAIAFPEKTEAERRRIACKSFESAAISMTELFMMGKIVKMKDRFNLEGTQDFDEAIVHEQGVILACSHLGAWECHEMIGQLKIRPIMVIVKNLKNPYVNHAINEMRRKTLIIPYSKDNAIRGVFEFVKKKGIAAILLDQWAGPEGIWIPFFGKETSTTTIAARFARKTSARLIPSFCIRVKPGHYKIINWPEIKIPDESRETESAVTRELNRVLEEMIRRYPEQWIWGHRRWKDRPQDMRTQN